MGTKSNFVVFTGLIRTKKRARQVERPLSTVENIIERIKQTGSPLPAKPTMKTYKINERNERHLGRIIWKNPFCFLQQIKKRTCSNEYPCS
ncbi:uncharacterized protein B0P05DRAFT_536482 [Gilbertella persicaria]|uniref:uncharacterized protein n=1 Tax=Gilbertella persicaria TaxID=101096 RepID=UPI00221F716C|nr:uncharacterized protein B0P05DRAFT_536482 [Gilbertella persicaria]KAI8083207.1 hypothetical protein B0P05DRAFT_536482 [Gilbertella persicaria]